MDNDLIKKYRESEVAKKAYKNYEAFMQGSYADADYNNQFYDMKEEELKVLAQKISTFLAKKYIGKDISIEHPLK